MKQIYIITCQYFYGTMEYPDKITGFVEEENKEKAIEVFKKCSEDYIDKFNEYEQSSNPYNGNKYFNINAFEIILIKCLKKQKI